MATPETRWRVCFVPEKLAVRQDQLLQRAFNSEPDSEVQLKRPQRPFLVDHRGELHDAVNRFFAGAKMRNLSWDTNRRYSYSMALLMNFLEHSGKSWDEASEVDLADFKFWRLTDGRNPRRISGKAWMTDLAAITAFYRFASRVLGAIPIPELLAAPGVRGTAWNRAAHLADFRASVVRRNDVKWLSPRAYVRWRNLGIHGISEDGHERTRWRPRTQSRDAAFVDGLYGGGLRLHEWSSVLMSELDRRAGGGRYTAFRLADACGKRGRGRSYWLERNVLQSIAIYRDTERARAVRMAQAAGRYDKLPDKLIVENASESGVLKIRRPGLASPMTMRLNELRPSERLKLFVHEPEGLQPAMLWLNENGLPRPKKAWYKAFDRANTRVEKAGVDRLECHPHMLRHSFALRWYAVGRMVWSSRFNGHDDEYRQDFREQFGDTWSLVQTLLGHADVSTTRDIYLEPFRHLEARLLLEHGKAALNAESLSALLAEDPRVRLMEDEVI